MTQRRRIPTKTLASAFSFFLLFLAIGAASPEANARDAERTALLQLKSSISDPADLLIGWSAAPGSDHCWCGISCDSRSCVVSLNISARASGGFSPYSSCSRFGPFLQGCSDPRRRLAGKLSPAVGKLSELRVLSLPFHGFDGEIPGEIWGLDNLEVLDLEGSSCCREEEDDGDDNGGDGSEGEEEG